MELILHTLKIQNSVFFKLISARTWFFSKDRKFMNNLNIRKLLQMHILHTLNIKIMHFLNVFFFFFNFES